MKSRKFAERILYASKILLEIRTAIFKVAQICFCNMIRFCWFESSTSWKCIQLLTIIQNQICIAKLNKVCSTMIRLMFYSLY